jgi:D-alanyl-D-alanine dipeptidase
MKRFFIYIALSALLLMIPGCSTRRPYGEGPETGLVSPAVPEEEKYAPTPAISGETPKEIKEVQGLVRIEDLDDTIVVDMRYAAENNFTGRKVYPADVCLIRRATGEKLVKANREFKTKGYRLKIWDAYRPVYVQKIFWDIVKDSRYVSNPNKGGLLAHCCGIAADVTLVDIEGHEVLMPTGFDDFSIKASRSYTKSSSEARRNMEYLTEVMKRNGFDTISSEWWHFLDSDRKGCKNLDVRLEEFLE